MRKSLNLRIFYEIDYWQDPNITLFIVLSRSLLCITALRQYRVEYLVCAHHKR